MKKISLLLIPVIFAASCTTTFSGSKTTPEKKDNNKIVSQKEDNGEYELIIIDNNFDRWYIISGHQYSNMSNEFYQTWNRLGAISWNSYYMQNRYSRVIENSIDYDSNINYGLEFNKKLYCYFKFIEERYGIRLLR